ncbi:glycyl-tRNA synthetase 1 [Metarhizium rileyi]|uniref:Glycyl-tRNA synthetase 1 n=1 Tax=Metarhizium rileyi (strain RCEF 4871) TaxID=1649241 RepID=A0A167FJS9_METRR|nr:glycyl-tRNA synthetase 1 [Metarhizium rileyi RCEF 4871]
MTKPSTSTSDLFNRSKFESLLKRRFFFAEAFEIYRTAPNYKGDNRGLYDYGPPGCSLLANIVNEWRKHFVIEENMLEVDCTAITPEAVLKTSGHVDRFADWMCKDPVNGEHLRADHLIETVLETRLANSRLAVADNNKNSKLEKLDSLQVQQYQEILAKIDNYDGPELGKLIKELDIRNPNGNGKVEEPTAFNLMFKSAIGPSSTSPVYFRPETAQGQFLNFRKLEFLMAEIEHFVDPESSKTYDRFNEVAGIELPFLDKNTQLSGKTAISTMSIGKAVEMRLVDNETLGYFLARVYLFLLKIGADSRKVRFRQHLDNEMAHYACDCWDAELLTSYGWIECVGCADRSAYDLTVHSRETGIPLTVKEARVTPLKVTEWKATLEKKLVGLRFRSDAKKIGTAIDQLDQDDLGRLATEIAETGAMTISTDELADGATSVELSSELCSIKRVTRLETVREYTPNVIEPSFGIGRILYSILEHVYWSRPQDAAREVLSLPVIVAPTKVLLVPLSNCAGFKPVIKRLAARLRAIGVANTIDSSSVSIGKRYARNDELGTPLAVTVDFDTLKDESITLRERDSTVQVRASEDEIIEAIRNLVSGGETWSQVSERLPETPRQSQDDWQR